VSSYLRFELMRTFRATRFFIFSLGFPLVLYFVIAGGQRHAVLGDIPLPLYLMTGMTAWGTMTAVTAGGGRIALERSVGWNRQLRLTPLKPWVYLGAKVATGYAMAMLSMVLLFGAGLTLGVHLPLSKWFLMTGLILIALVPFATIGITLGHLLTVDAMGPALGGVVTLFALFGGAWGPVATGGVVLRVAQSLPSYWLVQAGKTALGGDVWPVRGWVVLAVWTLAAGRIALWAYRRDTARV
jgi:ABC-2 type transport system permease protein